VDGRTLTSWPSVRTDVENAGGEWVDREVVVDDGVITSRSPKDLDAFVAAIIEHIEAGDAGAERMHA
jgi:protease I